MGSKQRFLRWHSMMLIIGTYLICLLLSACSAVVVPLQPPVPPRFFEYTILNQGENLRIIAEWFCRNENDWRNLYISAERDQRTLRPKDTVLIPVDLMHRTDPIEKSFVESRQVAVKPTNDRQTLETIETDKRQDAKDAEKAVKDDFLNTFSQPLKTPVH